MPSTLMQDKTPPHDIEAEEATLGALLLNPASLDDVISHLRSQDFYKSAHRNVFNTILALSNINEPIDLITVVRHLKAEGKLDSSGGSAYIAQLTDKVPTSANVEFYAKHVKECSIRRDLSRAADLMKADAHDVTQDYRTILDTAEKKISSP